MVKPYPWLLTWLATGNQKHPRSFDQGACNLQSQKKMLTTGASMVKGDLQHGGCPFGIPVKPQKKGYPQKRHAIEQGQGVLLADLVFGSERCVCVCVLGISIAEFVSGNSGRQAGIWISF